MAKDDMAIMSGLYDSANPVKKKKKESPYKGKWFTLHKLINSKHPELFLETNYPSLIGRYALIIIGFVVLPIVFLMFVLS